MKQVLTLLALMISINVGSGVFPVNETLEIIPVKNKQKENYNMFLKAIGKRESSNRYDNDNNMPFWGYYQIGPTVRETLNVKISWTEFKNDSTYQDYLMYKNLKYNEKRVKQAYFNYFVGKKINGIVITYSGILAGAHLAGGGGVRRFLATNGRYNPSDIYGTKLSDYIELFGGYDFNINQINIKDKQNGDSSNKTNIQVQRISIR